MRRIGMWVVGAFLSLQAVGCKPALLPGTRIEDTPENREIVGFLEEYRAAVESRSAQSVLQLVAGDYWEDNGTIDQSDDYGVEKLERELSELFSHTKALVLQVEVQHVATTEKGILVDYRYVQRSLLDLEAGEKWVSHADVNRLVLRPQAEGTTPAFVIVSGL